MVPKLLPVRHLIQLGNADTVPLGVEPVLYGVFTMGFDVLLVDPEDQDRLEGMIELVALATNKEEKAQQLLAFIDEQQSFLADDLDCFPASLS